MTANTKRDTLKMRQNLKAKIASSAAEAPAMAGVSTNADPDLISRWNDPAFLAEQKRICDAATKGPWISEPINDGESIQITTVERTGFRVVTEMYDGDIANVDFIIAARANYRSLIEAWEERQKPVVPTRVREWDGAFFCGACDELLVVDDQPYCHKCGTKMACDHDKGFAEYCAPCGRVNGE